MIRMEIHPRRPCRNAVMICVFVLQIILRLSSPVGGPISASVARPCGYAIMSSQPVSCTSISVSTAFRLECTSSHSVVVDVYPDDPQAQRGLLTCMDVLKKLDTVWPAAGRAWELLRGSRSGITLHGPLAGAAVPAIANLAAQTQRKRLSVKRSADVFVSDDAEEPYSPVSVADTRGQSSLVYGHQSHASSAIPQSTSTSVFFGPSSLPSAASSSSFERWSGSDQASSTDFISGLSTSGLPPQYSTGFTPEHRIQPPATAHRGPGARYPQYWNEFPPLGSQLPQTAYHPQRGHRSSMSGADALADIVGNHGSSSSSHELFYGLPPGTMLPSEVGGDYYNGASESGHTIAV